MATKTPKIFFHIMIEATIVMNCGRAEIRGPLLSDRAASASMVPSRVDQDLPSTVGSTPASTAITTPSAAPSVASQTPALQSSVPTIVPTESPSPYVTPTAVPCAGTSVEGFCWYLGAAAESCDKTCAPHGGYHDATRTYAGSGGTNEQCKKVALALGIMGAEQSVTEGAGKFGVGCSVWLDTNIDRATTLTTSDAYYGNTRRICACAN